VNPVPLRLGIIGAGGIVTSRHLPGFARIPDCQVVAVHNRRRARAEAVAREWGIPHVVDSPEAVWGRDDVNAVLIGTTPYRHRDLAVGALRAGKHVFCQARMARTLGEARDMLAAARAHPRQVAMLCPAPHVDAGDRFVREIIARGDLGELRLVRLQHLSESNLSAEAPLHWRMDAEVSGANVLTLGIYAEILHRWVGRARTVLASGTTFTRERRDPETGALREVRVPESVAVTGLLASGAHYVYTFSGVAACAPPDAIELYGTRGALRYEVPTHRLGLGRVEPGRHVRPGLVRAEDRGTLEPLEIPPGLRGEWRVEADFAAAIREGAPVYPSFEDGVAYMEFVEAVARSLAEGRALELPLP
jgi:predicted dehydrogenase